MGQPLYCSAAHVGMWGERSYGDGSTPYAWLNHITLVSMAAWLSSTGISYHNLPSHPLDPSLCGQQQLSPWDCSTIPKFQLPAIGPSMVCMAAARTLWFSFHLSFHRAAVSLSALNVSPLTQTIALVWGSDPCFSSPMLWGQVQSY